MRRRWLIRVPFLLALVLLVGVWVASYWRAFIGIGVWRGRGAAVAFAGGCGAGVAAWTLPVASNLDFDIEQNFSIEDVSARPPQYGFYLGEVRGVMTSRLLVVPLWLPAVLLVGLNWFVWRKTRRREEAQAFPVELAKVDAEKKEEPKG